MAAGPAGQGRLDSLAGVTFVGERLICGNRTKNVRAVQLLLGHTKLESTVRYLGIAVSDAVEIAEQTEV